MKIYKHFPDNNLFHFITTGQRIRWGWRYITAHTNKIKGKNNNSAKAGKYLQN